ncbi:tRNA-dependent cyclodipeptide synthase [Streptomyces sp. XD-27]|uniref:tRNA-dependent cyclodipeptide synthase n=1 Tax=Streptomyces sp. XD-27 TaxID=3062779 RepID=UPI0026F435C5|nr:tRNA-dependent cyclodipeptide synthase [Streptomyces sp. XD-27]WKX73827.1 tRNA-dependent cyclodipeptide synthase [Streptomyces sp. XD-27]
MFDTQPLTENCCAAQQKASHACIGVSPFNSYFSTRRLIALAEWALSEFDSCHFFVPDAVAAYTLEALGYPPARARHKAQRQGQYVHNKITTALRALSVDSPAELILGMARLDENPRYRELLDHAHALYADDPIFRRACLDASHWVLDRKLPPDTPPSPEQLRHAVRYFLAELPLFADSGGITQSGPSMFVYHHPVDFLERFYRNELTWSPVPGQGFLVVRERECAIPQDGGPLTGETAL